MEHIIKKVSFCSTVALGNAGTPYNNIYLNRGRELGGNTRVDDGDVDVIYSEDPRFIEVHVKKSGAIHLVPLSNVSAIMTEPVRK